MRTAVTDDWQVSILGPAGNPAGGGVIVPPRSVLACAHVVTSAMGGRPGDDPHATVTVSLGSGLSEDLSEPFPGTPDHRASVGRDLLEAVHVLVDGFDQDPAAVRQREADDIPHAHPPLARQRRCGGAVVP
ncbi:hypothetical protein ACWGIV_14815 [Streptomyces sp. NPDC054844]